MAGTACVGMRVPSHGIFHRLLELCGEPIAAPSANLFVHVSPTTAGHVQTDLGSTEELLIIDGGSATIGIESAIIKLKDDRVSIWRPGFVTSGDLWGVWGGQLQTVASEQEKQA
jgi:L-threonylcarbamoyladenylate synthase